MGGLQDSNSAGVQEFRVDVVQGGRIAVVQSWWLILNKLISVFFSVISVPLWFIF